MTIIDRLNYELRQKGITKHQLSKLSGVKRATIYNIFNENVDIKLNSLIEIAKILKVSLDYLVYGVTENTKKLPRIAMLYEDLSEKNKIRLEAYAEGMRVVERYRK